MFWAVRRICHGSVAVFSSIILASQDSSMVDIYLLEHNTIFGDGSALFVQFQDILGVISESFRQVFFFSRQFTK